MGEQISKHKDRRQPILVTHNSHNRKHEGRIGAQGSRSEACRDKGIQSLKYGHALAMLHINMAMLTGSVSENNLFGASEVACQLILIMA